MLKFQLDESESHEFDYYKVVSENSSELGAICQHVSGSYVFWPEGKFTGYWSSNMLLELAQKLKELNRE